HHPSRLALRYSRGISSATPTLWLSLRRDLSLRPGYFAPDQIQISIHHFRYQCVERHFVFPAKLRSGLGRVADEEINLCRANVAWMDFNEHLIGRCIIPLLVGTLSAPNDLPTDILESLLNKLPD